MEGMQLERHKPGRRDVSKDASYLHYKKCGFQHFGNLANTRDLKSGYTGLGCWDTDYCF